MGQQRPWKRLHRMLCELLRRKAIPKQIRILE
uniref:Uncharacterized protein n=1 Tax=Rhizophora mucronata TaxID=61149 RepID=A0A2P2NQW5_RHIMU